MNQPAAEILAKNLYAAVATTDASGNPWNATVFFVCDEAGSFYWASAADSQHSRNIRANGKVFLAIYDSTVPWGKGVGVFAQASAREVTDPHEIAKACRLRQARVPQANQPPTAFMGSNPRRIYCATPQHIWINQDGKKNGQFIDIRTAAEA